MLKTSPDFKPATAHRLKESFGDSAITSLDDQRITTAQVVFDQVPGWVPVADTFGPSWESRDSVIPGRVSYELSSHGPRATREVLTFDGESHQVSLMATFPDGSRRVLETMERDLHNQKVSHKYSSKVDCQG